MCAEATEKIKWRSISIPSSIVDEVEQVIKKLMGYSSIAEYVRDAIRSKLDRDRYLLEKKEEEQE